jgi:hypothetical protein
MRHLPLFLCLTTGCGMPDIKGTPLVNEGDPKPGGTAPSSPDPANDCTPRLEPMDPDSLPTCCSLGAAHCVPGDKLPDVVKPQLAACSGGGYCVPDPIIRSRAAAPPRCKSLGDADGVCLSLCVPTVEKYEALLPQDTCAADERCAPCINPLDGLPSGACDIGKPVACTDDDAGGGPTPPAPPGPPACPHTGPPIVDPATLPSCHAGGGAHCVASALVPAAMAAQLESCPTGLCAPDVFIAAGGQLIPPSCTSLAGAEGRCLHVAIKQVAAQKDLLPQATCQTFERCVPCFNPLDGTDTGACRLSCDPGPQKPKVQLSDCCVDNGVAVGTCVPTQSIPQALQSNLDEDVCVENAELCVPKEHLNPAYKPPACTANSLLIGSYSGVCLSDCLKLGIQGLALARGSCQRDYKCAPCVNPLTGQPSGAPGCPP